MKLLSHYNNLGVRDFSLLNILSHLKRVVPDMLFFPQYKYLEMRLFTSGLEGQINSRDCLL